MSEIDIKQEAYFPINFRFLGGGLVLGGLSYFFVPAEGFTLPVTILICLTLILLGLYLASARYGLKVSSKDRFYTIYVSVLGLKFGKPVNFRYIDKFYVNKAKETVSVTRQSTGISKDYSSYVFKAYMLLDNDEKIHLDTDRNEQVLEKRVNGYRKTLKSVHNPDTE